MGQAEFEETCERYLLGELSEAEQEQFEEAYFADDALFEQFLSVKDELLDAYARGELAEEKRKRFAAHYLASAANRRELEETRKFIRAVTEVSTKTDNLAKTKESVSDMNQKSSWLKTFGGFFSRRPFAWQAAFAVVVLFALGSLWLLVRNRQQSPNDQDIAGRLTPSPTTAAPVDENLNTAIPNNNIKTKSPTPVNVNKSPVNENQSPVNVKTTPQPTPEKTSVRTPPAQVASVVLMPFATRSINASNTLRLAPDARTVNIRLVFRGEDYRSYSVAVSTVGGASVVQRKMPGGDTKNSVSLQIAAELLQQKDYIVTLKGTTASNQTETIGEYYFRVERIQP